MKILNIKEKDLSIIIPHKNGHTLLYTTFIHLFNHLNIEFEMESNSSKFLGNSYIFVRNPIDRFFSSYFYMEFILGLGTGNFSERVRLLNESTNIHNISSYIKDYDNFINMCDDTHFIPQSSQILYNNEEGFLKKEIINGEIDINLLYENKFQKNYKIFKIEDIDKIMEENTLNLIYKDIGFSYNFTPVAFNVNKFDFLSDFSNEINFIFSTFYLYFKNLYQVSLHHKNVNYIDKITLEEYEKVRKITNNEYNFFKYDEKIIDKKLFKKILV
jgi:hypothetical protein